MSRGRAQIGQSSVRGRAKIGQSMCQNNVTARVECHEEELRLDSPVTEEALRLAVSVSE